MRYFSRGKDTKTKKTLFWLNIGMALPLALSNALPPELLRAVIVAKQ
jgi:hypothetical protein